MARPPWLGERIFYGAMGCGIATAVFLGFSPSYYQRGPGPALPLLLQIHGAVFTAWLLLFIVQSGLIAARRVAWHRRLGVAGALLAAAMLVVGTLTALREAAGAHSPAMYTFLAIPLFDMLVFGTLVGAALVWRKVPQTHKRLVLVASVGLLSPAIGRMSWPPALQGWISDFLLPDLFLLPLLVWDLRTLGRLHRATLGAGALLVGSQLLRLPLSHTDAWQRFAAWAASLTG